MGSSVGGGSVVGGSVVGGSVVGGSGSQECSAEHSRFESSFS